MLLLRLEVTHTPAKATAGSHRRRGSTGWGQCWYRGGWGGHRWDHQCGRCLVGECWECRAFIALLKTGTWIHEINKMQGSRRVQYEPVMRKCHESRKTNSVIWTWVPFKNIQNKRKKIHGSQSEQQAKKVARWMWRVPHTEPRKPWKKTGQEWRSTSPGACRGGWAAGSLLGCSLPSSPLGHGGVGNTSGEVEDEGRWGDSQVWARPSTSLSGLCRLLICRLGHPLWGQCGHDLGQGTEGCSTDGQAKATPALGNWW